jgi:hypothetical protein
VERAYRVLVGKLDGKRPLGKNIWECGERHTGVGRETCWKETTWKNIWECGERHTGVGRETCWKETTWKKYMGVWREAHRCWSGNLLERDNLEELGVDWRAVLKCIFKALDGGHEMD